MKWLFRLIQQIRLRSEKAAIYFEPVMNTNLLTICWCPRDIGGYPRAVLYVCVCKLMASIFFTRVHASDGNLFRN